MTWDERTQELLDQLDEWKHGEELAQRELHEPPENVVPTDGSPGDSIPSPIVDFCGAPAPADHLMWLPCRTYTRLIILRGRELRVIPCTCHFEVTATQPDDLAQEYVSLGGWMVCPDCRAYVDAGDADGLADFASRRHTAANPGHEWSIPVRELTAAAHTGYWRHRLPVN